MAQDPGAPPTVAHCGGVGQAVRTLNPGYFALTMATGIVSIAMENQYAHALSVALLWLAAVAYAVLLTLYVWRAVAFRADVVRDLADPARAFGYFTFVAATDVLGTRLAIDGHHGAALVLLAVGSLAWLVLGYVIPWTAVLGNSGRPLVQHANGTWFIWVVASQSIAVLAAGLEPAVSSGRRELALLAVFSWSVGVFLYGAAGVFVAMRMLLYPLRPGDLTPPYWVSMGATAITVVAGARIVQMADAPMVDATRGLIAGTSVLFWAFGTWLVPALYRRRHLAPPGAPHPVALRGAAVEHRVPPRHVWRRRPLPRPGRPPAHRGGHRGVRELGRTRCLDRDVRGVAGAPARVAEPSGVRARPALTRHPAMSTTADCRVAGREALVR